MKRPPIVPASLPPGLLLQGGLALGLFILAAVRPPVHLFEDQGHYLVLHLTVEFLSIAAALMIFTVGWFSFGSSCPRPNRERGRPGPAGEKPGAGRPGSFGNKRSGRLPEDDQRPADAALIIAGDSHGTHDRTRRAAA